MASCRVHVMAIFAGLANHPRLLQIWVICIANRTTAVNTNKVHIVAF